MSTDEARAAPGGAGTGTAFMRLTLAPLLRCVKKPAAGRVYPGSSRGTLCYKSTIQRGGETMSTIESVLHETRAFPPSEAFVKQANISGKAAYEAMCKEAERDMPGFWAKLARENLRWTKPFTQVLDESNAPFFKWFHDGELNASYNCLDRHLSTQPDKIAIIFEADDGQVTKVTYKELYHRVCQFANALKSKGVQKGERVLIYMPMSIEAVVAMQACARIGATHSVVFGGFSAKSVQERIQDAGAVALITADGQFRGGKEIPLKPACDEAIGMGGCDSIRSVIVYKRSC